MTEHVTKPLTYVKIFVALLVLTALTVGFSRLPVGATWHMVFGLAIATAKALLVILFFMHVIYSSRLTWVVALGGLLWLAILIFLTMNDYLTRHWYPYNSFRARVLPALQIGIRYAGDELTFVPGTPEAKQ